MSAANNGQLVLTQIQGNIIGFNKQFQHFFFLNFGEDRENALGWLRSIAHAVTTAEEVVQFREALEVLKTNPGAPQPAKEPWFNLAFTYAGLEFLGNVPLAGLPQEFIAGMAGRANELRDIEANAPANWKYPKAEQPPIHALLILAANAGDLGNFRDFDDFVAAQRRSLVAAGLKEPLYEQRGQDRKGARGTEHFGFRDGVSQPALDDAELLRRDPPEPSQDRIQPGEFVLGYPRQDPEGKAASRAADKSSPDWTKNGSYLVLRRLSQNVDDFNAFVKGEAARLKMSEELFRAKLVGRYRSGAALAALTPQELATAEQVAQVDRAAPGADPGTDPGRNFSYKTDPDGERVPRGAHIRRLNARNKGAPDHPAAQTRRILRRGIPFLEEDGERGLLFLCYQSSIANQFEFLQQSWANDSRFPGGGPPGVQPGRDPLIGAGPPNRQFNMPSPADKGREVTLQQWVTVTGGDYFFSPSVAALGLFASEPPIGGGTLQSADAEGASVRESTLPVAPLEAEKQYAPTGSGDCKLQITVAFNDLDPNYYYPWRIWVNGRPVWVSQLNDYLVPNNIGFASATMTVRLLRIFEALEPEQMVRDVVRKLQQAGAEDFPREVLGPYPAWQVELITDPDDKNGTVIAARRRDAAMNPNQPLNQPPVEPAWAAGPVGIMSTIDMGIKNP